MAKLIDSVSFSIKKALKKASGWTQFLDPNSSNSSEDLYPALLVDLIADHG
jgi:hypothetical protein